MVLINSGALAGNPFMVDREFLAQGKSQVFVPDIPCVELRALTYQADVLAITLLFTPYAMSNMAFVQKTQDTLTLHIYHQIFFEYK